MARGRLPRARRPAPPTGGGAGHGPALDRGAGVVQAAPVRCFACDAEIPLAAGERVGFRDTCPRCGADAHVCLNCAHHDPGAQNQCREPQAEPVRDRDRANRCDWFRPGGAGGGHVEDERQRARRDLDSLFKK